MNFQRWNRRERQISIVFRADFGRIMAEIFAYREDVWEPTLRRMGFYLGKFIYLMDAYDDVEDDVKKWKLQPLFRKKDYIIKRV